MPRIVGFIVVAGLAAARPAAAEDAFWRYPSDTKQTAEVRRADRRDVRRHRIRSGAVRRGPWDIRFGKRGATLAVGIGQHVTWSTQEIVACDERVAGPERGRWRASGNRTTRALVGKGPSVHHEVRASLVESTWVVPRAKAHCPLLLRIAVDGLDVAPPDGGEIALTDEEGRTRLRVVSARLVDARGVVSPATLAALVGGVEVRSVPPANARFPVALRVQFGRETELSNPSVSAGHHELIGTAFDGERYFVLWRSPGGVLAGATVEPGGALGPTVTINEDREELKSPTHGKYALAGSEGVFLVLWVADRGQRQDARLMAVRVRGRDSKVLDRPALDLGPQQSGAQLVIATGSGFDILWSVPDAMHRETQAIHLARLSTTGGFDGTSLVLTRPGGYASDLAAARTGDRLWVTWKQTDEPDPTKMVVSGFDATTGRPTLPLRYTRRGDYHDPQRLLPSTDGKVLLAWKTSEDTFGVRFDASGKVLDAAPRLLRGEGSGYLVAVTRALDQPGWVGWWEYDGLWPRRLTPDFALVDVERPVLAKLEQPRFITPGTSSWLLASGGRGERKGRVFVVNAEFDPVRGEGQPILTSELGSLHAMQAVRLGKHVIVRVVGGGLVALDLSGEEVTFTGERGGWRRPGWTTPAREALSVRGTRALRIHQVQGELRAEQLRVRRGAFVFGDSHLVEKAPEAKGLYGLPARPIFRRVSAHPDRARHLVAWADTKMAYISRKESAQIGVLRVSASGRAVERLEPMDVPGRVGSGPIVAGDGRRGLVVWHQHPPHNAGTWRGEMLARRFDLRRWRWIDDEPFSLGQGGVALARLECRKGRCSVWIDRTQAQVEGLFEVTVSLTGAPEPRAELVLAPNRRGLEPNVQAPWAVPLRSARVRLPSGDAMCWSVSHPWRWDLRCARVDSHGRPTGYTPAGIGWPVADRATLVGAVSVGGDRILVVYNRERQGVPRVAVRVFEMP